MAHAKPQGLSRPQPFPFWQVVAALLLPFAIILAVQLVGRVSSLISNPPDRSPQLSASSGFTALGHPSHLAFSADGAEIFVGKSDGRLAKFSLSGGKEIGFFQFNEDDFAASNSLLSSADGTLRVRVDSNKPAQVIDTKTLAPICALGDRPAWDAALAPHGKRALTADEDGTVVLWEIPTGRRIRALADPDCEYPAVLSLGFACGGDVAVIDRIERAEFWDLRERRLIGIFSHRGDAAALGAGLLVSPDGQIAYMPTEGSDGAYMSAWRAADAKKLARFMVSDSSAGLSMSMVISAAAISPDGTRLAIADILGTIHVFDVPVFEDD